LIKSIASGFSILFAECDPSGCGNAQGPTVPKSQFGQTAPAASALAAAPDEPAVNELAMSITDDLTVAGESIGKGGLNSRSEWS